MGRVLHLVIAAERALELDSETCQQKSTHVGQLCVDDRSNSGIDRSESYTGRLCLHEATAEETTATDEIFTKEVRDNHFDVAGVDLVDQTID